MRVKKRTTALLIAAAFAVSIPASVLAVTLTRSATVTGAVRVGGALSKGSGTFVIDHPLDPKHKLLYHSFVESPDVKNLYDGIATLNTKGEATVTLPDYFLALNKDFRYLATPVGAAMPDLHLSADIHRAYGIFGSIELKISGGAPNGKVSWQVTGIRHDVFIQDHPIVTEVEKGPNEAVGVGEYICPECYAQ